MRTIARAFTVPERIASRLNRSGRRQAFQQHGDVGGVAADRDHIDSARAIFGEKQFAIRGAHTVWPLDRLVHPDVDGFARLAAGVHWNSIEFVEDHVVFIKRVADESDAVYPKQG